LWRADIENVFKKSKRPDTQVLLSKRALIRKYLRRGCIGRTWRTSSRGCRFKWRRTPLPSPPAPSARFRE
jgi:hypothetical protein